MWAIRAKAPGALEQVEVPAPSSADLPLGGAIVRTLAGGICGSDIPRFRGLKTTPGNGVDPFPGAPGIPLHEIVGEVVEARHECVREGELVVGWATHHDGFAEYVVTDATQLWKYQSDLTPERAVLIQSIACVLYGIERLPVSDAHVAVLGLGPIGLLFAHALKSAGARWVTGIDRVDRSDVAEHFGVNDAVCAGTDQWAKALTEAQRPHIVVEAIGHQVGTLQHAIDAVTPTGTILYFGIPDQPFYPLDMERVMRKNITLIGGITRRRRAMLAAADAYLHAHPALYDHLVTDIFAASEAQAAYERASFPARGRRKVLVTMQ